MKIRSPLPGKAGAALAVCLVAGSTAVGAAASRGDAPPRSARTPDWTAQITWTTSGLADGAHLLLGRYTGPGVPGGTQRLYAIVVDQGRLHGRVIAYHGTSIARQARTTAQASERRSLAAVNGGFFTNAGQLASVAGIPTGLGVYDGRLQSLADGSRADLVLDGRHVARIRNLRTVVRLRVADRSVRVRGVNRQLGTAQDCGVVGFMPTSGPQQGGMCTGADDLVLFTSMFATTLPACAGCLQILLDASGDVVCAAPACAPSIPRDGAAIQASGSYATRLARLLALHQPPAHVTVTQRLYDAHTGANLALRHETSIASAAPILLRRGQVSVDADAPREGIPATFLTENAGRTMAGIDRQGRLLLVTADGPPPAGRGPQPPSAGITAYDAANVMRRLGAVTAMNLDGGGSATFVVRGRLRNVPTDSVQSSGPTGERAVGDTIQVVADRG